MLHLPLGAASVAAATAAAVPDRAIIVSRHGVRRQFPSSAFNFSLYAPGKHFDTSDEAWGAGGEGMGVLTQHGYDAVQRMGAYQSGRYASLLSAADGGCADGAAFVYCEENMPRDEKTAEAFFKGLGCALPPLHSEGVEYLIDQGSKPRGENGQCALGTQAQVEGRVGGSVDGYLRLYKPLLAKLSELLGCCAKSLCPAGMESCSLEDLPGSWDAAHWYTTFSGPIYAGKYFAEWIELTMLNGMDFAWGKLSVEEVMELSAFVTQYRAFEFDLLAARPFGSALLSHIAASLTQWESGQREPALAHDPSPRLVYYAAHDTNLLYLAELLGLKWLSHGYQPNHTPPGGALVFEAFGPANPANPLDEWQIALYFDIQTPLQIRELTVLSDDDPATTPSRVPVTIPGCSTKAEDDPHAPLLCPLSTFTRLVRQAVQPECITPPDLRAFAEGKASARSRGSHPGPIPLTNAGIFAGGAMLALMIVAVWVAVERRTGGGMLVVTREKMENVSLVSVPGV